MFTHRVVRTEGGSIHFPPLYVRGLSELVVKSWSSPEDFLYLTLFPALWTPDLVSFAVFNHQSLQALFTVDVLTCQHFWLLKLFETNSTFEIFLYSFLRSGHLSHQLLKDNTDILSRHGINHGFIFGI